MDARNTTEADESRVAVLKKQFLKPENAYAVSDVLKSAGLGAYGFAPLNQVSNSTSVWIGVTIEALCTAFATVTFVCEMVNVIHAQATGVTRKTNGSFIGGHSLYLSFRACCILASIAAIILISVFYPRQQQSLNNTTNSTSTPTSPSAASFTDPALISGMVLKIGSNICSHWLTALFKPKTRDLKTIKSKNDLKEIIIDNADKDNVDADKEIEMANTNSILKRTI